MVILLKIGENDDNNVTKRTAIIIIITYVLSGMLRKIQ